MWKVNPPPIPGIMESILLMLWQEGPHLGMGAIWPRRLYSVSAHWAGVALPPVFPQFSSVHFSSVAQLCPTLFDLMNRGMQGLPVHHQLPESTWELVMSIESVMDSCPWWNSCPLSQWCHPTISSPVIPSPPALNLSQHQGLFQWVSSSHQVAKVLEFQL